MNQTVLITGGAGFVGGHLAKAMLDRGYSIMVLDDLSTGRPENIQPLMGHPRFKFVRGSVSDATVLDQLASQCGAIVHLAAAVGVRLIIDRPVHTIETNVMGTEAVLKAALRYSCKVLIASTSEVYGKGIAVPFAEDDDIVLGPTIRSRWAYAASKMVDEFLGLAYHKEYGLPVVVFRLFNTVGPRQTGRYGMVIPRFIDQAIKGEALTVYGDGQQSRCFLHVSDAVRAIVGLLEEEKAVGSVFNVGSTEETKIVDLASRVLGLVGSVTGSNHEDPEERIQFVPYDQAFGTGFEDMHRRVPDLARIQSILNWEPEKTLEEILLDTISDRMREQTSVRHKDF